MNGRTRPRATIGPSQLPSKAPRDYAIFACGFGHVCYAHGGSVHLSLGGHQTSRHQIRSRRLSVRGVLSTDSTVVDAVVRQPLRRGVDMFHNETGLADCRWARFLRWRMVTINSTTRACPIRFLLPSNLGLGNSWKCREVTGLLHVQQPRRLVNILVPSP